MHYARTLPECVPQAEVFEARKAKSKKKTQRIVCAHGIDVCPVADTGGGVGWGGGSGRNHPHE